MSPNVVIKLQLGISMGPPYCISDTPQNINGPRCSYRQPHTHIQWAHPITSAMSPKTKISSNVPIGSQMHIYSTMGPLCCIGSTSQINNRPRHSHWQLWLHISMGPPYCIGDTSRNINRPRCSYQQPHAYIQLAHLVALGALPKKIIGPNVAIGSHICIYSGPTMLHREHFQSQKLA